MLKALFEKGLQLYWNNRWKKKRLLYKARGKYYMDIRNLIVTKSVILEQIILDNKWYKLKTINEKALAIHKWVTNNIKYVSDTEEYKTQEYWQHPEITLQKRKGDCEDGALLIASLLRNRLMGIPAYRVKLCAGYVQLKEQNLVGHAYVIFLSETHFPGRWYVLDWCYYPNISKISFDKIPHKSINFYKKVWWTFNDEYAWYG